MKKLRRYGSPTNGCRFIGNTNTTEVHDLDNERTGGNECQIDELISGGNVTTFNPDTLEQALSEGYDACAYCLSGSKR